MSPEILYKIKNNQDYLHYLRHNSNWYKYLNRNPIYFKEFEKQVKEFKRNMVGVRIKNTLDTIEMLENVISTLK